MVKCDSTSLVKRRGDYSFWACVLVVGMFVSLGGCREELHHDLPERAANEIVVALAQSEIPARKSADGEAWTVTVPSTEYQRALTVLAARNLPREETDIFSLLEGSGGLVPSVEEEQLRKVSILTTELEQTFLSMDSVVDAHVHAVLPRSSGLRGTRGDVEPPSASVVIVYRAGLLPPGDESIRSILRGAIPSLASEQISTVLVETEMPEATSAELVALGPFTVSSTSARGLRWTLTGLLATVVILLLLLGWVRLRRPHGPRAEAA